MENLLERPENPFRESKQTTFQKKLARQNTDPSTKGEAITYLLENLDIVNQPDRDGDTPLMNAADSGCVESVKILVGRGANVNALSPDDAFSALHMACRYDCPETLEIARILVEAGALVDEPMYSGWTPVMLADQAGHVELQKYLLEKGAKSGQLQKHFQSLKSL